MKFLATRLWARNNIYNDVSASGTNNSVFL